MNVQLKPKAANAFDMELFNRKGEVTCRLEIHTSELNGKQRLEILRREQNFKPFKVLIRSLDTLNETILRETHHIIIEE